MDSSAEECWERTSGRWSQAYRVFNRSSDFDPTYTRGLSEFFIRKVYIQADVSRYIGFSNVNRCPDVVPNLTRTNLREWLGARGGPESWRLQYGPKR